MISITIHPVDMAGKYAARLDGRLLCESNTPFFSAARVLIARGKDPTERLAMFRDGKSEPDLTGQLGAAAELAVQGERFVKFKPPVGTARKTAPARQINSIPKRSNPDPWAQIRAGVAAI
jgi:hypothetical protein